MKRLSFCVALLSALTLATCSNDKPSNGELALNLNAQGPRGLYELCAVFELDGPVNQLLSSRPNPPDAPCTLAPVSVPAGQYSVRLMDGWGLRLVGAGGIPEDAELLSPNTQSVLVESHQMARVVFRFRVDGVELEMPGGSDAGVQDAEADPDSGNPGEADGGQPDTGAPPPPDAGPPPPPVCPPLPMACNSDWYSDGECDPVNNFAACGWDSGDCCASTCTHPDCGDFLFDCRDPAAGGNSGQLPPTIGTPCAPVPSPFDPVRMSTEVALLSSDALMGRDPGFMGDLMTRDYLERRFQCMGLDAPPSGCYQQRFANEGDSDDMDPTANVVGIIAGGDPAVAQEVIVVGGHHDHLGVINGEVHNGANDNASGIVALMAIAQQIKNSGATPRRTIVFVAFGSEESGLEGALHYVNNPPSGLPMSDVVYMVNLDMLATYDVIGSVDAFGTHVGTPGRELLDATLRTHPDLVVNLGLISPVEDSDYDPFCALGIPHVYFETFDPPCWHEACDDASRIDAPHLAELSEVLHGVVVGLANTTIDLAAARTTVGCRR